MVVSLLHPAQTIKGFQPEWGSAASGSMHYTACAPWLKRSGQGYKTHNSVPSWDSFFASNEVGRLLVTPTQDSVLVTNNHLKHLYKVTCRRGDKHVSFYHYRHRIHHSPTENKNTNCGTQVALCLPMACPVRAEFLNYQDKDWLTGQVIFIQNNSNTFLVWYLLIPIQLKHFGRKLSKIQQFCSSIWSLGRLPINIP